MNATKKNIFKALLGAIIVAGFVSGIFAFVMLLFLTAIEQQEPTGWWNVIRAAAEMIWTPFIPLTLIVWPFSYALLQRFTLKPDR